MLLVPSLPHTPLTIDALLRVIAERDAEVALLKHMVDKLELQLARRVREQYGRSSEQLDTQLTLIPAEAPKANETSAAQPPNTKPRKPRRALVIGGHRLFGKDRNASVERGFDHGGVGNRRRGHDYSGNQ